MKILSKIKLLALAAATSTVLMPVTIHAEHHASNKGMDVPRIGSMVVMSGLENPWDMAFTKDGSMF